jgi:hypothetical protein
VAVLVIGGLAGLGGVVVGVRNQMGISGSSSTPGSLSAAQLATLSLAQTPDAMAKVTGVAASPPAGSHITMLLPLTGSSFKRIELDWDTSDPSHVRSVLLLGDGTPRDAAAIRKRFAALLGRRLDKDGVMQWNSARVGFHNDDARADADLQGPYGKNPHWQAQVDAGWDVLRAAALGQNVTVTDAEKRDWLGAGYTLAAVGAIDPATASDHAADAMDAAFPGVQIQPGTDPIGRLAVDHPWFGEAELTWDHSIARGLGTVDLRPPPQSSSAFPNRGEIVTCLEVVAGAEPEVGPSDPQWKLADGGEVRVYDHMIEVSLASLAVPKHMTRAGFQKLLSGLDACGRKK